MNLLRSIARNAVILALFAVVGTALVGLTEEGTRDRIAQNERQELLARLAQVVPAAIHDNDLLQDQLEVNVPDLGDGKPITVYRARMAGQPAAAVLSVIAPDGYAGPIKLLVGIDVAGRITGVRVVAHKETPGLGDNIELSKSNWVLGFDGKSLEDPTPDKWKVKKDGGVFDQFTGATITPRIVTRTVFRTLDFFQTHRDELFAQETPAS